MNDISWPVMVLAVIALLAGAVVGEALRTSAGGSAAQSESIVMAGGAHP